MIGNTSAMRTAYLLFPCADSVTIYFDLLLALEAREVTDLLKRMALAHKMGRRRQGPSALVYFNGLRIQFAKVRPAQEVRPVTGGSKPFAVAVHPSVSEDFLPAGPAGNGIGLHVEGDRVFLSGVYRGEYFQTMEAMWSEVMRCRLATAQARVIPKLFQEFSSGDPRSAGDILESGIVLLGNREPVRDVRPLLSPADLITLLEWPEADVRERAIAAMGSLRRSA